MKKRGASQGVMILFVMVAVGCGQPSPVATPQSEESLPSAELESITASLEELPIDEFFEESYEQLLLRKPETLTALGISERFGLRNDRLNDLSDAYLKETQALESAVFNLLHTYNRASLTSDQQLNYDAYEWYLDNQVRGHPFMYHNYPLNHMIYSYDFNLILFFEESHAIDSLEDAEDYITRLWLVDDQTEQVLEGLQIRKKMGIIPPDFIIEQTFGRMMYYLGINRISADAVDPTSLSVYTTFVDRLGAVDSLDDAKRQSLENGALAAIEASFIPAFVKLLEHLEEIQPLATSDAGVWKLPDGEAYYDYLIHRETTTNLTAEEIHQLGLSEVDRIHSEMYAAFEAVGYPTDLSLGELRRRTMMDAGFFNGSTSSGRQEILDYYDTLFASIEAKLPEAFDVGPSAEMIIIPEGINTTAFYSPGSVDGTRPGSFHVGLAGSSIPIYNIATTAYHEGTPGHHFQIALAQELDLPMFRAYEQYNGFAEGWALYSERLAYEMGIYEDAPYSNIGRLELELVRAIRLVTDTGIHSLGWTRSEARQYMIDQMGDDSWAHEVDRYVVMPGQALSYKVGMLEILALRDRAKETLGDKFDLIEFHHVILTNGSLPLSILGQVVDDYIASQH